MQIKSLEEIMAIVSLVNDKEKIASEDKRSLIQYWIKLDDADNFSNIDKLVLRDEDTDSTAAGYSTILNAAFRNELPTNLYDIALDSSNTEPNATMKIFECIVRSFTSFYKSEFGVRSFCDISLFADLNYMLAHGPSVFNTVINILNNENSNRDINSTKLDIILSEYNSRDNSHIDIMCANDKVSTECIIAWREISQAIGLTRKAKRAMMVITLPEEYNIVIFGVALMEDIQTKTKIDEIEYLTTVDLDTEDVSAEYKNFIKTIFSDNTKSLLELKQINE